MSPVRRDGIAALAICVGLAVSPAAWAAGRPAPSPDSAALSVYVESVPTSKGPKPFWGLPSARAARGGAVAGTLGRVAATAPPVTKAEGVRAPAGRRDAGDGGAPTSWPSSARAAAGPAVRQHRAALAVIALATIALLWAAARRRRHA